MDTAQTTVQGADGEALAWAFRKLTAAFPPSFPDERAIEEKVALWREMLDAHPWVTGPAFRRGVARICWEHKGDFVPPPATTLDFFHAAKREVEAEAAKRLPPPPVAAADGAGWRALSGPQRAAVLERHLAIGRLRSVHRAYDVKVPFLPPGGEQEIVGMIGEMRARRFCHRLLERVASGEDVSPAEFAGTAQQEGRR